MAQDEVKVDARIAPIEAAVAAHNVRLDEAERRLTQVETKADDIHRIATAIELISHDTEHTSEALVNLRDDMNANISELKSGQDKIADKQEKLTEQVVELQQAPAKKTLSKLEEYKGKIIWLIVAGAVGWILANLGDIIRFISSQNSTP
jgi:chromosome segregation ATPase